MYTLYGFPGTRSLRVAWALEEMGLPYEYKVVNLLKGEHREAAYKALTPTAKVPLLVGNGLNMTESSAILCQLADIHGYQEFIPAVATPERASFEQAMFFLATELEQPLWSMVKHAFALPEAYRLAGMKDCGTYEYQHALEVFAKTLGDNEFVVGNMFTVADILAGHTLMWAREAGQELLHDNVSAYCARLEAREAFAAARRCEDSHKPG